MGYYNIDKIKCNMKPKRSKNNGPLWDSLLATGRQFCMLFVEGFTLYGFGFASGVVSERTALRNVSGEPSP